MRRNRRFSYLHLRRIRVTNRLSGEPMGVIGDLSVTGLRLIGRQPLAVGGCYDMRLHVQERGEKVRHVDVKMICQWSRKDSAHAVFHMGCALDQPSAEYDELVAGLLMRRAAEPDEGELA